MITSKIVRRKSALVAAVAAVLLCATPCAAQKMQNAQKVQRDPVPMPEVNTDTLMKHVRELSSETYQGRLAGSAGYDRAVRYAKRVLAAYGMEELTEQPFTTECNEVENCKFNTYVPGSKDKRVFTLGNEFCCVGMTGRGYVDAQMVFCGYGVDHKAMDEYKYVDVKGKIAVVLTGLPEGHGLPQKVAEHYLTLRDKARTAEKHGAIGMLAINVSPSCLPYEPQGRAWCGELPHLPTFPMLQLTLDCAREIFAGEQMPVDSAIVRIARERKPQSFALLKKAEIDVNAYYRPQAKTCNVVALLKGNDDLLAKEYVVVGASLDGLGMQGETCLFPSADINATGVAAVLETARLLSQSAYRPKRSVLFVLFGGGEQQFLGSRMFVNSYPKLNRIEAFINMQNIGYGDSLVVLGDNRYPSLWEEAHFCDTSSRTFDMSFNDIQRLWPSATMHGNNKGDSLVMLDDYRFTIMKKLTSHSFLVGGRHNMMLPAEKSNPRGDARAFDAVGIPSLVITTHHGMHHNHVTTDVWENIDRRILTLAAQLAADLTCQIGEGLYQGRSPKSRNGRPE